MLCPPQAMEGIADVYVGAEEARKHDFVDTNELYTPFSTVLEI